MNILQNHQKCQEKWVLKWKEKEYIQIKEQIKKKSPKHIFIRICGKKEEKKLPFTFKEKLEVGGLVEGQISLKSLKKKKEESNQKKKKNIEEKKKRSIKKKQKEGPIREQKRILIYYTKNQKYKHQK